MDKWTFGFEQDPLPYFMQGVFTSVWVGKNHLRTRFLLESGRKPEFLLSEPFTNRQVSTISISADYFLRENWKGWWAGGGFAYWYNTIQTNAYFGISKFDLYLLNSSLGYSWKFYKNFYISPWVGLDFKVIGPRAVEINSSYFKPAIINPEASIKIGWHF